MPWRGAWVGEPGSSLGRQAAPCWARPRLHSCGVHPYELSYYNELIGGPRGAWARGFELTYWYDAFNP